VKVISYCTLIHSNNSYQCMNTLNWSKPYWDLDDTWMWPCSFDWTCFGSLRNVTWFKATSILIKYEKKVFLTHHILHNLCNTGLKCNHNDQMVKELDNHKRWMSSNKSSSKLFCTGWCLCRWKYNLFAQLEENTSNKNDFFKNRQRLLFTTSLSWVFPIIATWTSMLNSN